jgi:flagellar motor switch/type III secretory pathway protein FliN
MVSNQMAASQSLPKQVTTQAIAAEAHGAKESANGQALVTVPPQEPESDESFAFPAPVSLLPVELDVAVPVREFRVRNLLALEPGQLIQSQWGNGEDVPLASGEVQLAWSEFEVIESWLAVRVTRLA